MSYYVGDRVIIRLSEDETIISDMDFDDQTSSSFIYTKSFEIIGLHQTYYILLVPSNIEGAIELTDNQIDLFKLPSKYEYLFAYMIKGYAIGGREKFEDIKCCCCKQWFTYAQPNQEDGRFACWSCKTDERYKLIYNIK